MTEDAMPGDYAGLHKEVVNVVESARRTAARNVNAVMTAAYWEIGRQIVATEQGGQALIARLADDLTRRFGRGFGKANLASMRAFYVAWPAAEIFQTVTGKSAAPENFQTPSGKLLPSICARCLFRTPEVRCSRRCVRTPRTHAGYNGRIRQVHERKSYHKTLIAIANKHARMLWAMLAKNDHYDADAWQRHPMHPPLPSATA
ncbi:hypothetical protein OKW39_004649 [Paraburkholderia sp. MM6662-R1]